MNLRFEKFYQRNKFFLFSEAESYKVELFDEVLSFSYTDKNTKHKMVDLINTDSKEVFSPKSKYVELVGKDKEVATNLEVVKRLALATSRSFIFQVSYYQRLKIIVMRRYIKIYFK